MVSQIFTSWNSLISWLTRIDSFRLAASEPRRLEGRVPDRDG
jgi:hypothetical protein